MYCKLSINNVKKSYQDFLLYFMTIAFAVCLFYVFNSVESQQAVMKMSKSTSQMLKGLVYIMNSLSVFISFVVGFLIVYANNFLIKRRKKEFGIYMLLGMGKRKMARVLMLETLIIGICSLAVGLLVGIFASQWLSILTAKLFEADMSDYTFIFSFPAFYKTLLYFGVIFLVVMILSTLSITRYKLIDLLNAAKRNEKPRIKNPVLTLILFLLSIAFLGTAYGLVIKNGISIFDEKLVAEMVMGAIGTFLFFASLSGFFLQVIQRSKKRYFKGLNMFVLRQINSRINTAHISISFVCLMLFCTIGILATGMGINNVMSANYKSGTPYDATFSSSGPESILKSFYTDGFDIDSYAKESYEYQTYSFETLTLKEVFGKVKEYLPKDMNGASDTEGINTLFASELSMIKLSDYNSLLAMQGKSPITLADGTVALYSDYAGETKSLKLVLDKFIEKDYSVDIQGKTYSVHQNLETAGVTTSMGNNLLTLIVPDSVVENAVISKTILNLNCKGNSEEMQQKLLDDTEQFYPERFRNTLSLTTREQIRSNSVGAKAIISFVGIYLGLIFLITSAAVLALQQLSEVSDNRNRYLILKKIGADEKQVSRAIFKQVLIYFLLPLLLACVHSVVGLYVANRAVSTIGDFDATTNIIITAILILAVYGTYFLATFFGSKRIVIKN